MCLYVYCTNFSTNAIVEEVCIVFLYNSKSIVCSIIADCQEEATNYTLCTQILPYTIAIQMRDW